MRQLGVLLKDTRDLIAERTSRRWDDDMLRKWVQAGAADIAREIECLQDTKSITALALTQQYALPDNVVRVYRVEWKRNSDEFIYPLEYRDFHNMDDVWATSQAITTNRPEVFSMWGFPPQLNMIVYPTPSDGGSFKLYYYRLPRELAIDGSDDASYVEVPEGWHDLAVEYAVYMALRRDADPRWQEALQLYTTKLATLNENALRWTDQAGMVASGQNRWVPGWLWNENWSGY